MKELNVTELQEVSGGGGMGGGVRDDIATPILFGGKFAGGMEPFGGSANSGVNW
jgi:bacteriocin-like protein